MQYGMPSRVGPSLAARAGTKVLLDFFGYVADFAPTVAASATATVSIAVQADADFEWRTISHSIHEDNTSVNNEYSIQIQDSGSGRNLFDRPASSFSVVGSAFRPYILPAPKLVARNSNLTVTIVNLNATAIPNLRVLFAGYKVFTVPA